MPATPSPIADRVKDVIRAFVKHHGAKRVLLYYLGPLSGACFIGHRLNAICREIQIMEWSDLDYHTSRLHAELIAPPFPGTVFAHGMVLMRSRSSPVTRIMSGG